jgi:hypothetical protein
MKSSLQYLMSCFVVHRMRILEVLGIIRFEFPHVPVAKACHEDEINGYRGRAKEPSMFGPRLSNGIQSRLEGLEGRHGGLSSPVCGKEDTATTARAIASSDSGCWR